MIRKHWEKQEKFRPDFLFDFSEINLDIMNLLEVKIKSESLGFRNIIFLLFNYSELN